MSLPIGYVVVECSTPKYFWEYMLPAPSDDTVAVLAYFLKWIFPFPEIPNSITAKSIFQCLSTYIKGWDYQLLRIKQ